jgi:translation initiation factor 2 beta subunit (eIF-2beta)/eIF-5
MAYRACNTIENQLTQKQHQHIEEYSKSGIYKLKCKSYDKIYIGQKGRTFRTRCKEHVRAVSYNGVNSIFAKPNP